MNKKLSANAAYYSLIVVLFFSVGYIIKRQCVGANVVVPQPDYVAQYLAARPPQITREDWMQIDGGAPMADPDAPFLYLYSAVGRNPNVRRFRVTWSLGDYNFSDNRVATYNRGSRTLWCQTNYIREGDDSILYKLSTLTGVTPQLLLHAAETTVGNAQGSVADELVKLGCKRTIRSYYKKWLEPQSQTTHK